MNVEQFLEEMKRIQESLLDYLEDESSVDDNFEKLNSYFKEIKIHEDQHKLMSLLHLLLAIANNYHRNTIFFEKIDNILKLFQDDLKKYYSNAEIFNTFKSNKRILLFLLEQKIMIIDEYIAKKMIGKEPDFSQYEQFFSPEIELFKNEKWFKTDQIFNKDELPDNFYENRKTGENESYICQLIRNDSIKEFIIYVNKNNISLNAVIKRSIFETNQFLILKPPNFELTLINYAAFFGSIQIFRYLHMNGADINSSVWIFAIHGKNAEIIHFIEESNISPDKKGIAMFGIFGSNKTHLYSECLKESIKCHHNDIANYIQTNFIPQRKIINNSACFENYNFAFIQSDSIDKFMLFYRICELGHYLIAFYLLKNYDIDVENILKLNHLIKFIHINNSKAFYQAIKNENIEIIKLLLSYDKTDLNFINIIIYIIFNGIR